MNGKLLFLKVEDIHVHKVDLQQVSLQCTVICKVFTFQFMRIKSLYSSTSKETTTICLLELMDLRNELGRRPNHFNKLEPFSWDQNHDSHDCVGGAPTIWREPITKKSNWSEIPSVTVFVGCYMTTCQHLIWRTARKDYSQSRHHHTTHQLII